MQVGGSLHATWDLGELDLPHLGLCFAFRQGSVGLSHKHLDSSLDL